MPVNPLSSLKPRIHQIPSHHHIPNTSSHNIPLLIYPQAFSNTTPSLIESTFSSNNWTPSWRYPMYQKFHYHSTTHEALGVYQGSAKLGFGGFGEGKKIEGVQVEETVRAGDAIIIPAGVAHMMIEDLEEGGEKFMMVGAYPRGAKQWDMCYGEAKEEMVDALARMKKIKLPDSDPVYGTEGVLMEQWVLER